MLTIKDLTVLNDLDGAAMSGVAGGLRTGSFYSIGLATSPTAADDSRLPDLDIRPATLMERINCAEHGTKC